MNTLLRKTALLFALFQAVVLNAQDLDAYNWKEAKHIAMDNRFANESQVFILRKQTIELNYQEKKDQISKLFLNHFIIQVNDDEALKERNELEFPVVLGARELIEFKARIIKKDGTVIEFKKSDAKEKPISQRNKKEDEEEDEEEKSTGIKMPKKLTNTTIYRHFKKGINWSISL